MLNRILLFLSLLLPLILATPAEAQSVYRWVDDEGKTHYGQTVPPQYKDYGYVRLGPDGTIRDRVEPALSPEEIAERRRQRAEQAKRDADERDQQTRDRMLLATYNSVDDLHQALQLQLAGIESQRVSTRKAVQLVENRFEGLVSRAAQLDRKGQAVPEQLQTRIRETRTELRGLRADLERLDEREAEARERFSADLERYRELTSRSDENG
ncbi:DUF4124 domain-containing protein [Wenzhouxiangella sp. EGI_FJ10305]|uniref:DUF4124 domain-containing protein n=1 Tax=Wenzhouxiangella sp. EGI_FJ10305 TaxID=3243768 RepID=UPI0035E35BEA